MICNGVTTFVYRLTDHNLKPNYRVHLC